MRDKQETMELRDLVGPFKGRVRTYLRHAGENAIASGFAELPEENPPQEVAPAPPAPEVIEPLAAEGDLDVPVLELPEDFPGRVDLEAFGIESLQGVPTDLAELVAIPGIGKATAKRILKALGG